MYNAADVCFQTRWTGLPGTPSTGAHWHRGTQWQRPRPGLPVRYDPTLRCWVLWRFQFQNYISAIWRKKKCCNKTGIRCLPIFLCEKIDSTVIVNFTLSWEIYSREAKFEFVLLCLSVSEKTNNILKKCCPPTRWGLVFGLGCLFFNFILWLLQLPG